MQDRQASVSTHQQVNDPDIWTIHTGKEEGGDVSEKHDSCFKSLSRLVKVLYLNTDRQIQSNMHIALYKCSVW